MLFLKTFWSVALGLKYVGLSDYSELLLHPLLLLQTLLLLRLLLRLSLCVQFLRSAAPAK